MGGGRGRSVPHHNAFSTRPDKIHQAKLRALLTRCLPSAEPTWRDRTKPLIRWWRTQSESNPSPTHEFPANREINREFCRIRLVNAILKADTRANSEACSEIPYSAEQGIFAKEQGICTQRTGNFSRQVTIICRTRFLIGRYYQPCPPPTEACHRHRPEPHRAGARQGGGARFFADIFGLPFDAPSCHFAARVNDSLTFLFDDDASPDPGSTRAAHSTAPPPHQFFSLALTIHVGLAYTKHARTARCSFSEVAQRRLLHRAPSQGRI
jgi:hypothetical protein